MAITKGHKANFKTLLTAAANNDLALMECTDKVTGLPVIALCMASRQLEEYVLTPVAKFFDGNPYDELNPAT